MDKVAKLEKLVDTLIQRNELLVVQLKELKSLKYKTEILPQKETAHDVLGLSKEEVKKELDQYIEELDLCISDAKAMIQNIK